MFGTGVSVSYSSQHVIASGYGRGPDRLATATGLSNCPSAVRSRRPRAPATLIVSAPPCAASSWRWTAIGGKRGILMDQSDNYHDDDEACHLGKASSCDTKSLCHS